MVNVPVIDKITLTVEEASAISNIGINKIYELTNDPRCSFVLWSGKKRLIKRKAFEDYLIKHYEI